MFNRKMIAAAVALAFAGAAQAQDAELAKIREEIRQMKESYERRIETLEKRLSEAEGKARKPTEDAAGPAAVQSPGPVQSAAAAANAFNPAISLILQGTLSGTSQDPNTYQITGFMPSGGEVGPPKRSFGLVLSTRGTDQLCVSELGPQHRRRVHARHRLDAGSCLTARLRRQTNVRPDSRRTPGFLDGVAGQDVDAVDEQRTADRRRRQPHRRGP
jgi:hypothetical protein